MNTCESHSLISLCRNFGVSNNCHVPEVQRALRNFLKDYYDYQQAYGGDLKEDSALFSAFVTSYKKKLPCLEDMSVNVEMGLDVPMYIHHLLRYVRNRALGDFCIDAAATLKNNDWGTTYIRKISKRLNLNDFYSMYSLVFSCNPCALRGVFSNGVAGYSWEIDMYSCDNGTLLVLKNCQDKDEVEPAFHQLHEAILERLGLSMKTDYGPFEDGEEPG